MKEFAAAEWDRAHRALSSAQSLVESDPDSATSRAYYAAFHALTAVFALRDQSFTKHSAIRAALHRDLINSGQLPTECGRDYDFLLDLREMADYGGISQTTSDSAAIGVAKAEDFLAHLAGLDGGPEKVKE